MLFPIFDLLCSFGVFAMARISAIAEAPPAVYLCPPSILRLALAASGLTKLEVALRSDLHFQKVARLFPGAQRCRQADVDKLCLALPLLRSLVEKRAQLIEEAKAARQPGAADGH